MDQDKGRSFAEIADAWVSYHVWSANRQRPDHADAEQLRQDDAEAKRHGFWAWEAVEDLVRQNPEEAWTMILRLIEVSPDDRTLANVAAGPLEDLLGLHSYTFIDRVEKEAHRDDKFRRCLSGVWEGTIPADVLVRMRRTWEGEDPL